MSDAGDLWLSCLGHQSFAVCRGAHLVLVDPMLGRSFGTNPELQFQVYPPREVRLDALPPVTAIVLTSEHLDQFHLPTLAGLPSRPGVYCGQLMPACTTEALRRLGYQVHQPREGEEVQLGSLRLRLYRGGAESALHVQRAQRVCNALLSAPGGPSILFQSDAAISSALRAEIESGALQPPSCAVVTNNSQVSLPGSPTPWLHVPIPEPKGLSVLHSVLAAAELVGARDVVLHSSGYVHPRAGQGPYLWADHRRVAELAEELAPRARIHGLDPGEALRVGGGPPLRRTLPWVALDEDARQALWDEHLRAWQRGSVEVPPPQSILPPLLGVREEVEARRAVTEEMGRMGQVLRASPLLAGADCFGPPEAQRSGDAVVLRLRPAEGPAWRWVYDRHRARFFQRDGAESAGDEVAPFGMETFLVDFHALLTGQIQAWELVTCGLLEHWSPPGRVDGWLEFVFAYFGEQVRPELASQTFQRLLRQG